MTPRFTVLNPCPKKWDDLEGEGRQRYCDACDKSVHAIGQYSENEWDKIWRESGGHACGLIAATPAVAPRSRRAVLIGALLTAVSPLMAQTGRVRIRVTDMSGVVIPGAEISLLSADGNVLRKMDTNPAGEAVWSDLPIGDNRVSVAARGFSHQNLTVTVTGDGEAAAAVALPTEVTMGEVVVVGKEKRRRWLF